jgi:hypothetical protein
MIVVASLLAGAARGQDSVESQLRALAEQNRKLQEQVQQQARALEQLRGELGTLQERVDPPGVVKLPAGGREREIHLSGQAGIAFFKTGSAGQFPNAEFRLDDAKINLEAPVMKNLYVVAGLDWQTRETSDESPSLGEFYVDFENVSGAWGRDRLVNLRAGRFGIPFGEEYQVRDPVANPLISHSVADVWGQDEGVELYGELDRFNYVLAVQNGGNSLLHDYNSDKSVAGRLGYQAARWLRVSASAMRTGELNMKNDALSALWFGNGFFRALGAAATTTTFSAELAEADVAAHWKGGAFKAAAGTVKFADDDTTRSNARHLRYYAIEAVQDLVRGLFAAVRLSEIRSTRGYPLVGWGNFGTYLFASPPTTDLRRLSLGLGYRLSRPVVVKFEYALEHGHLATGVERDHENLLSTELALQF